MKSFIIVLLAAGLILSNLCKAQGGPVQGEGQYRFSRTRTVTHNDSARRFDKVPQARQSPPLKSGREHLETNWRISYYLHANATPWWPTAPGG